MSSVTSMLTSIGIGAPPASFSDAEKAAKDQKAAVGGLTSTVSGISSSLSLVSATGAPASVTGPMKDNLASANTLMANASSMTPAELTKKTAAIQAKHDIDKANHANVMRDKDLEELTASAKATEIIVKRILADARTSQKTRDDCASIMQEIEEGKRRISTARFTREQFVVSGGTGQEGSVEPPLIYTRPKVITPEDIEIRIETIQDSYDDETDNNVGKVGRKGMIIWTKYVWPTIFFSLFAFCVLMAGIVSSNACLPYELYSAYNRAYYFIYGAILFPITLPMYGILYPPEWYSTFCPLYSNNGTGPAVADDPPGKASAVSSALSSVSSFFGMGGGAEGLSAAATELAGGAEGLSAAATELAGGSATLPARVAAPVAAPTLKGGIYYFYPLVANAQSKSTLGKLSLVATILVWGYIIGAGGMALFSSF